MSTKTTELLKKLIEDRKKINHRISLRSLAKKIDIPSGRLSEILNGKRRLTDYYLEKFCAALALSDEDISTLRKAHYDEAYADGKDSHTDEFSTVLSLKQIETLTNWKLYALMSFLQTSTYATVVESAATRDQQIQEMSKYLGIEKTEISSLVNTMESLKLVAWSEGRWAPIHNNATTGYDIPSKYIQESHQQVLSLAKEKLPTVDVTKRDYSSVTLTISPDDLVKAKKMIRVFRRNFVETFEKEPKKDVYQLAIQFFPITNSGE